MIININFKEYQLDIAVTEMDDLKWEVFDINSDHINLLDTLLHEKYDDEVSELIMNEIDEKNAENEMERQLSAGEY